MAVADLGDYALQSQTAGVLERLAAVDFELSRPIGFRTIDACDNGRRPALMVARPILPWSALQRVCRGFLPQSSLKGDSARPKVRANGLVWGPDASRPEIVARRAASFV
jgi:hypothetical protein